MPVLQLCWCYSFARCSVFKKEMKRRCFSAPLRKYKRLCYSESPVSSCASNDPWGNKEIDLEKMSSELNRTKIEPEKWDDNHFNILHFCIAPKSLENVTQPPDWYHVLNQVNTLSNCNYTMKHLKKGIERLQSKLPAFYDIMSNFEGFQLDAIKNLVSKEEEEERSKKRSEENERSKECTKPKGISFKNKGKIIKRASSSACNCICNLNPDSSQLMQSSVMVNGMQVDSDDEDINMRNYKKCCLDVQMHKEFLTKEDMLVAFDIFMDPKACVAYLACESVDLKVGFVKRHVVKQACPDSATSDNKSRCVKAKQLQSNPSNNKSNFYINMRF